MDLCVQCNEGEWCHVLCAELIMRTRFLNNAAVLNALLNSLPIKRYTVPTKQSLRSQLIASSKIANIVPSSSVMVSPPIRPPPSATIFHCSICGHPILGRAIHCWHRPLSPLTRSHDKCAFCAHPICLSRSDASAWSFLCDRRVPSAKVRVVCRAHSALFVSDLYLLSPSFPQISLLAALACERVLAAHPAEPRGAAPHMETRSKQKPFLPRTSERRSRRRAAPTAAPAGMASEERAPASKRGARRPAYSVRQFVREVEEMLSFETGAAFWPQFQHCTEEVIFREVAPCVVAPRRAADYAEERNVLWNWCDERLLHRCSETAGTRLVRVLLQGFYTAELLLCVKPLNGETGNPMGNPMGSPSGNPMGNPMGNLMGNLMGTEDPRGTEIGVLWTPVANEMANCGETVEP